MFKNDIGFKKLKNVNISITLHSFVHYSPRDVHRIADKLNNVRFLGTCMSTGLKTNNHNALMHVIHFVCNPVDIPRTIMHKRMQFNA